MNVSGVVDIAIVLTIVYLALSVIVSQINEWIATLLSLRGRALYNGIVQLLGGSVAFADAVMDHPVVASTSTNFQAQPSYVAPRNFSIALWQAVAVSQPPANDQVGKVGFDVAQLANMPTTAIPALQQAVANLPGPGLRIQLNTLLSAAGNDYNALLNATDAWFNRQMDRVSGWYRRQAQWIILLITVALVVLLGVDSVRITTRLTVDPTLRQSMSASLNKIVTAPAPAASAAPALLNQQALMSALDDPTFVSVFVSPPWTETQWGNWRHWLGLVVTLLAVMLGAPFWFDVLQNIANMRLSGPKPSS
jgi:hypothetical protein